MAKEQTQSLDLRPGKRMAVALSNENLRIGASTAWQAKIAGTLDESRMGLDFEIGKGGIVKEIDRSISIPKRIKAILDANNIPDPNTGLTDEQLEQKGTGIRTYASFILQGSHDTMERLAFGEQQVDYNPGADNSHLERKEEIEKWAVDMYKFMAMKYGEENIASFVVHLDETTPHAHCVVVPITDSHKLSFKEVFVGKDKYEFAKRTRQIWDEAAAIAEKYGMKRGEDKRLTGRQHKSYLQWLKEQILGGEEKLKEQEKEIRNNTSAIASQKQQLYFLNGQIKLAEKKLKSFQTMIKNLETQKQQLEQEISALNEQHKTGKISYDELQRRTIDLNNQINEINSKLIDKKNKYNEAEQQLQTLRDQKKNVQDDLDDLKEKKELAEKELPEILDKAQSKTNDSFWEIATEEAKKDYTAFEDFSKKLPTNLKSEFNSILENSFFEDIAQRGEEMAGVAAGLFLGYVDQATSFAHSSGGGGGHPGNWGRKKDEDDEAYLRRCCIMGRMMMRPAGRKLKRT